jgi:hypothetical protein
MTFRMHLKKGRSTGKGVYMREGPILRVMLASGPKVIFLPDSSTNPENYLWF